MIEQTELEELKETVADLKRDNAELLKVLKALVATSDRLPSIDNLSVEDQRHEVEFCEAWEDAASLIKRFEWDGSTPNDD